MQSKTFTADTPDAVIKAVNDWLAGESRIAIRKTETTPTDPKPGEPVRFCIWYEHEHG